MAVLVLDFDICRKKPPSPTEFSGDGHLGEIGSDKTVLYRDIVSLQKAMMVSYTLLPIWLGILISMVSSTDVFGCTMLVHGSKDIILYTYRIHRRQVSSVHFPQLHDSIPTAVGVFVSLHNSCVTPAVRQTMSSQKNKFVISTLILSFPVKSTP